MLGSVFGGSLQATPDSPQKHDLPVKQHKCCRSKSVLLVAVAAEVNTCCDKDSDGCVPDDDEGDDDATLKTRSYLSLPYPNCRV